MEKLNPQAQAFLAGMADAPPPPETPLGDPTKPASEEERASWQKQNAMFCGLMSMLVTEGTLEKCIQDTELFRYPSEDGMYEIESRFYRAKGEKPAPLVIHFHGGGMTMLKRDVGYEAQVCSIMRECGVSVLTVEFRNARDFHFPAGR